MAARDDYPIDHLGDASDDRTIGVLLGLRDRMCDDIDQLRASIAEIHATDFRLGLIALRKLREFADEFGPDPINDEPDEWTGSGADHAAQLYLILEAVGLKP